MDGEGGKPAAGVEPAAVSLARQIIAGRVEDVREDAELLQRSVRVLLRVPVSNGHLVKLAADDVDSSLKTLLACIARLCVGFD